MKPIIGYGSRYTVRLLDRFTGQSVAPSPMKVKFERQERGYGSWEATFGAVPALADVTYWRWEAHIMREGFTECIGPVSSIRLADDKVFLGGPDRLGWAQKRRLRTSRSLKGADTATVAAIVLADALGLPADPIEFIVESALTGTEIDYSWSADQGVLASRVLHDLWSTYKLPGGSAVRTYHVPTGDVVARLANAAFIGEVPEIDYDGAGYASQVFVRGLNGSAEFPAAPLGVGGVVDLVLDQSEAKTNDAVRAAARREWNVASSAAGTLRFGSATRLAPSAKLSIDDLRPGARFEVSTTDPFGRTWTSALALAHVSFLVGSDTNPARTAGGKFASDAQLGTEYVEATFRGVEA